MLPLALRRRRAHEEPFLPTQRFFDRLFNPWWLEEPRPESDLTGAYPVDIREENGNLVVEAELPGFKPDEIDVSVDRGVLSITAEREPAETQGKRHLTERRYTRVERQFTLPTTVDESKVQATLDDGLLRLELPKTDENKRRRIEIAQAK